MKRLYKSRKDRVIDGVCAGIAEYFEIDPVIVRLIMVLLFFWSGTGLLVYIIGMIIIPVQPEVEQSQDPSASSSAVSGRNQNLVGIILIILGFLGLFKTVPALTGYWWWLRSTSFLPIALIIAGLYLLFRSSGSKKPVKKEEKPPEKKL